MSHYVLLGDSIFDNAPYIGGAPDTVARLRERLPLVELRSVCTEPADYANPIEPSSEGSRKIAAALLATVGEGPGRRN